MTREEKIRVQQLRSEGKKYREIASETGIAISTITSFCLKHLNDAYGTCLQCGAKLVQTPKKKKKKFCSDRCRMLWWNSHQDQVNRQTFFKGICKHCGREFYSYGSKQRLFCSRVCTDAFRKESNRLARSGKQPDELLPCDERCGQNA